MLEQLIAELRSGGTFEMGDLAARLGTTPEMLKVMLEHLQRIGFIQPFRACGDTCSDCGLGSNCRKAQFGTNSSDSLQLFTVQIP